MLGFTVSRVNHFNTGIIYRFGLLPLRVDLYLHLYAQDPCTDPHVGYPRHIVTVFVND